MQQRESCELQSRCRASLDQNLAPWTRWDFQRISSFAQRQQCGFKEGEGFNWSWGLLDKEQEGGRRASSDLFSQTFPQKFSLSPPKLVISPPPSKPSQPFCLPEPTPHSCYTYTSSYIACQINIETYTSPQPTSLATIPVLLCLLHQLLLYIHLSTNNISCYNTSATMLATPTPAIHTPQASLPNKRWNIHLSTTNISCYSTSATIFAYPLLLAIHTSQHLTANPKSQK